MVIFHLLQGHIAWNLPEDAYNDTRIDETEELDSGTPAAISCIGFSLDAEV